VAHTAATGSQVTASKGLFHATCNQLDIPPLELLLWVRTCWASLFKFLECFIKLRVMRNLFLTMSHAQSHTLSQAINQFILLTDTSDDVPPLSNHHSYADFHLTQRDWEHLEGIKAAQFDAHVTLVLGTVKHSANFLK
jgi:hypothetical protein